MKKWTLTYSLLLMLDIAETSRRMVVILLQLYRYFVSENQGKVPAKLACVITSWTLRVPFSGIGLLVPCISGANRSIQYNV